MQRRPAIDPYDAATKSMALNAYVVDFKTLMERTPSRAWSIGTFTIAGLLFVAGIVAAIVGY